MFRIFSSSHGVTRLGHSLYIHVWTQPFVTKSRLFLWTVGRVARITKKGPYLSLILAVSFPRENILQGLLLRNHIYIQLFTNFAVKSRKACFKTRLYFLWEVFSSILKMGIVGTLVFVTQIFRWWRSLFLFLVYTVSNVRGDRQTLQLGQMFKNEEWQYNV